MDARPSYCPPTPPRSEVGDISPSCRLGIDIKMQSKTSISFIINTLDENQQECAHAMLAMAATQNTSDPCFSPPTSLSPISDPGRPLQSSSTAVFSPDYHHHHHNQVQCLTESFRHAGIRSHSRSRSLSPRLPSAVLPSLRLSPKPSASCSSRQRAGRPAGAVAKLPSHRRRFALIPRKYTQEQLDFIIYLNTDKQLPWKAIVEYYNGYFKETDSRACQGVQAVYYRDNRHIPAFDNEGLPVFDRNGRRVTYECKVRDQTRSRGRRIGLIERAPERAFDYPWVDPEDKARVEKQATKIKAFLAQRKAETPNEGDDLDREGEQEGGGPSWAVADPRA